MTTPEQNTNQEVPNSDAGGTSPGGFWEFMGKAFSFLGKIADVLKNDKLLSILWGFAVLLLILLIVVLVLGGLSDVAKLTITIMTMLILVGLYVYTMSRWKSATYSASTNETRPINDKAGVVIRDFYQFIERKEYPEAYKLIHKSRIATIQQTDPQFGPERFASTYATTRQYDNLHIEFKDENSQSRNYIVEFDVIDEFPRNRLYNLSQEIFNDVFNRGAISPQHMITEVIENLKDYYDVPENIIPWIQQFVGTTQFSFLFDQELIAEIKRNIEKSKGILLVLKDNHPPTVRVLRHYIQNIQLIKENKAWMIGEGLGQSSLVAPYIIPTPS